MSVKVGVRVRPFNKRQLQLDCRRCVQMQKTTTKLIDNQGNVKNFVFDYSFWSHDKFMVDPDGIFIPVDDKYDDQQQVYKQIGSSILVNAWQGYNCCLFAYGQTGSGKSYSMIGYGPNRGIIPIVCDQIFKKIQLNKQKTITFQVQISMMEIYNQTVRDLLQKNKKKQLKICQSKKFGVYVQGLYKHPVHSYGQIAKKIQQGSNNRSIAATLMNESSSRSHTIVSINFVQKIQVSASSTSIKHSVIHLVDLAGSQCVAKTGVDSKDRLRQTAKINQSLSTLGRVIQILADNATKIQKQFVPYRDSKLTFILRNALGGNSRTAMICAISPADDNYEQTLSTLRYANRAKNILNKAIVNESDVDKLIRMLRQQNQMLKRMLQQAKFTKTIINMEVVQNYQRMSHDMSQFGININENSQQNLLQGMGIQFQPQKSQITQADSQDQQDQNTSNQDNKLINQNSEKLLLPYITNVSEDQLLSFRVKYCCQDLIIGNKQGQPKPDVVLAALGIQSNHARIYIDGQVDGIKQVYLEILSLQAQDYTYLNGQNVMFNQKKQLFDNDRLIFGTSCIFLVVIFGGHQRNQQNIIKIQDIDYQFAIKQLQNINLDRSKFFSNQIQQQMRKKIVSEVQKQYQDIKKINQQNLKKQIQKQQLEYQQKLKQIQNKKNEQTEKLKLQLDRKHNEAKNLQQQKIKIKQQIQKYYLMQKQIEKQLQQRIQKQKNNQNESIIRQNEQLLKNNQILQEKMSKIAQLEQKIGQINKQNQQKQIQIKHQIQYQQQLVQKQLQIKTIMCQNQNILTEYKLQLIKRTKNGKQLRELLVKKQKAFLQKQLIQLVPMIQKFNLMAKQMKRKIQAGLSIEYKFISQAQMIQALKNNTYKSKLKILIHVINKQQHRGYYWSIEVFKNRFQHAIDSFQSYISNNLQSRQSIINIDKLKDPYWEPLSFQLYGLGYLSLQCLLYQFSYNGVINIVNQGKKFGQMQINLFPLINQGGTLVRQDNSLNEFKIFNPRDLIQRSLSFQIQIKNIQINSAFQIQKIKVEYELLQSNYKTRKYQTNQIQYLKLQDYIYNRNHTITEISQNTILHYTDRPIAIYVTAIIKLNQEDQLTNRQSFISQNVSSFATNSASQKKNLNQQDDIFNNVRTIEYGGFTQVPNPSMKAKKLDFSQQKMLKNNKSGAIVQNTQIISKIQNQFQKKKKENAEIQERKRKINSIHIDQKKRKPSQRQNCIIF